MDKLSRYNQKLLAVIGTMTLVGLGMLLLTGGFFFISEISRSFRRDNVRDNALTVEANHVNPDGQKVKTQEISFSTPRLIDTLKTLYLIPVSQVNLQVPEAERDVVDISSSAYGKRSKYSYYQYTGSFNNIILFNQKENRKAAAFKEKVNINSFRNYMISGKHYLLIEGTADDSNKDGKLKESDLQSFFIYNIDDDILKSVSINGAGLVEYYILNDTDEIILRFGFDKDKNGEYDNYTEPTYLKKYSISENKTTDLLEPEMIKGLQDLIQ